MRTKVEIHESCPEEMVDTIKFHSVPIVAAGCSYVFIVFMPITLVGYSNLATENSALLSDKNEPHNPIDGSTEQLVFDIALAILHRVCN